MLTTQERNELVATAKHLQEHPFADMLGQADEIEDRLTADQAEMFACSESIARGDACLSCEQVWVPDGPPTKFDQQRKLDHLPTCVYSNRLMEEDL